jgi:hypothetical protein
MTSRTAAGLTVLLDLVVGAVLLGGVGLFVANSSVFDANTAFLFGLFGVTSIVYAATGTLIARRHASNPIAWLCFAIAFLRRMNVGFSPHGPTPTSNVVLRAAIGSGQEGEIVESGTTPR